MRTALFVGLVLVANAIEPIEGFEVKLITIFILLAMCGFADGADFVYWRIRGRR